MSTTIKLLLPLTTPTINKKYLSKEYGFEEAYTCDIDAPYSGECIILLYDINLKDEKGVERSEYMINNGLFPKFIKSKGKLYTSYKLSFKCEDALYYWKYKFPSYSDESKKKTILYWNGEENDVNDYIFNSWHNTKYEFEHTTLMESKPIDDLDMYFGITIKKTPSTT